MHAHSRRTEPVTKLIVCSVGARSKSIAKPQADQRDRPAWHLSSLPLRSRPARSSGDVEHDDR